MGSARLRTMASPLFLDEPRDDFGDSAWHRIDLGVKAIDLGGEAIKPAVHGIKSSVDLLKSLVDLLKSLVDLLKSLVDLLKSLLDILLESKEVEMDLSKGREQKSYLSFHLAHPPFEARNTLFKRCRSHRGS